MKKNIRLNVLAIIAGSLALALMVMMALTTTRTSQLQSQAIGNAYVAPEESLKKDKACFLCQYQKINECGGVSDQQSCDDVVVNDIEECTYFHGTCMSRFEAACRIRERDFISEQKAKGNEYTSNVISYWDDPEKPEYYAGCDSMSIYYEGHNQPREAPWLCRNTPLLFCIQTNPSCANISYVNTGCSTFQNLDELNEFAMRLRNALPPGVTMTVSGNQAVEGMCITDSGTISKTSASQTTATITCEEANIQLPACSPNGTTCSATENPKSYTCKDEEGNLGKQICCVTNYQSGALGVIMPGDTCPNVPIPYWPHCHSTSDACNEPHGATSQCTLPNNTVGSETCCAGPGGIKSYVRGASCGPDIRTSHTPLP